MKSFLFRVISFIAILSVFACLFLYLIYRQPGLLGFAYTKYTSPKSNVMILGSSRSSVGIVPDSIDKLIFNNEKICINHAFAVPISSYGPAYYNDIINKLDTNSHNGLFIIGVEPGLLVTSKENTNDEASEFVEVKHNMIVGALKKNAANPNFEYLIKYWEDRSLPLENLYKYIMKYDVVERVQPNGWVSFRLSCDSSVSAQKILDGSEWYIERMSMQKFSQSRFNYLIILIEKLRKYGEIVLVRLPISSTLASIENELYPSFDSLMRKVERDMGIRYINFIEQSGYYQTLDHSHLCSEEARYFTKALCDSIESFP